MAAGQRLRPTGRCRARAAAPDAPQRTGEIQVLGADRRRRRQSERLGLADLTELDRERPDVVEQLEAGVVAAAVKNPIPRFQRIDEDLIEFLYHWPWGTDRSPRAVAQAQGRADDEPHLEFVAGIADSLRRLEPVLRPVVEDQMVLDVATYNNLHTSTEAVRDHLFGTNRWPIPTPLRDALKEVQHGQCAYCGGVLERAHVDHLVPWAWRPNNAVENLVLADQACNSAKSNRFAAAGHVETWLATYDARSRVGGQLGPDVPGVFSDPLRSLGIARHSYKALAPGQTWWRSHDSTPERPHPREHRRVLALLDAALAEREAGSPSAPGLTLAAEPHGEWDEI